MPPPPIDIETHSQFNARHDPMQALPLLLCLAAATTPTPTPGAGEARIVRRLSSMGTGLQIEVQATDRLRALKASEAAVRALETTEARLSTWVDDSELAGLNAAPVDLWVDLSPTLAMELGRARELWLETKGAFDPGVGALVEAWDLRGPGRTPSDRELAAATSASGLHNLTVEAGRAKRLHPGLALEEGAFGKGAGLDQALKALENAGATRATIDLGGQMAFLGQGPFMVEVADPLDRNVALLSFTVDGGSVATSGNSERSRIIDGVRVGHLLDPRTGQQAAALGSMTVWSRSALDADALATGLLVLGAERALEHAARTPGIEVLVLEPRPGDVVAARFSAGLVPLISPIPEDRERVLLLRYKANSTK